MTQLAWQENRQDKPPVSWDAGSKKFSIVLGGLKDVPDGAVIEAEWTPPLTYVIRIREAKGGAWSVGFETPLFTCSFVGLSPNTEYEVEVTSKNAIGESSPVLTRFQTDQHGSVGSNTP